MTGSAIVVGAVLALGLLLLRFAVILLAAGGVIVRVGLRPALQPPPSLCRWRSVAPFPAVLLRFGQTVVGLLDADAVPRLAFRAGA